MRRNITPDELNTLVHDIGMCVWHLQYVEDALSMVLATKVDIRVPGGVTEHEAAEVLAKHRRSTLGTALKVCERHDAVSADLLERLKKYKEERDWLVHRSMHETEDDLYTDEGRVGMTTRLWTFFAESRALVKEIKKEAMEFVAGHGLPWQAASDIASKRIAALRGDA